MHRRREVSDKGGKLRFGFSRGPGFEHSPYDRTANDDPITVSCCRASVLGSGDTDPENDGHVTVLSDAFG
jgi:hypothetical protein